MNSAEKLATGRHRDAVAAIAGHLHDGDDVTRCAAARALGALDEAGAAPHLVEALLDEDPDVRADAMTALVACARPSDADAIRRSLMGDPVKEVKIAAIEALCALRDQASIPLLRSLAKDRCDHDIAWEDAHGMWDEWLDVQIAAIESLGEIGVSDAIDDLLEARADEMGQDVDHVVLAALAAMPHAGPAALLAIARDGTHTLKQRSIAALSKAAPEHLDDLVEELLRDPVADVRILAVGCLAPDAPELEHLALHDDTAAVRMAAITAIAPVRTNIVHAALGDGDEAVRACALDALVEQDQTEVEVPDLAANVEAWMRTCGPRLAACSAAALPHLCGSAAQPALCEVAADEDRPLEARIAALHALGGIATQPSIATLRDAAVDKVRQVRASALAALATIANGAPPVAAELAASILVQVLRGGLQAGGGAASEPNAPEPESDTVVASKVEEAASDRITITRDGEIVPVGETRHDNEDAAIPEFDASHEAPAFPTSTLEAIQSPVTRVSDVTEEPLSEDELEHLSASRGDARKRRVAVDGPKDVVDDARRVALRIAAPCPSVAIGEVLGDIVKAGSPDLRGAAVEAIALRAQTVGLEPSLAEAAVEMLSDQEPLVRGHAVRAVAAAGAGVQDRLLPLLNDPDAVVRAAVLQALPVLEAEHAGNALADSSPLVRQAVLDRLIEDDADADLAAAMAICLETRWTAGMAKACEASASAREFILDVLTSHEAKPGQKLGALEALGAMRTA